MGAAELTGGSTRGSVTDSERYARAKPATHGLRIGLAFASLWTITLLGAAIGTAVPTLAPGERPHPTLHGSLGDLASIAGTNARVLSAPFLLTLFRWPAHRPTRQLGDLMTGGVFVGNALRVGLALGRWHARLLPYVPQLPIEWLAAAVAAGSWLALRTGVRRQTTLAYLAAVLILVVAAAAVETIATPHASARDVNPRAEIDGQRTSFSGPTLWAEGRGWIACARIVRRRRDSLQGRFAPFPSLSLGSARPSGRRCRATSTTPGSRKGGTTVNAVCVIWNCFQIAHSAGCGLLCVEGGLDRCGC